MGPAGRVLLGGDEAAVRAVQDHMGRLTIGLPMSCKRAASMVGVIWGSIRGGRTGLNGRVFVSHSLTSAAGPALMAVAPIGMGGVRT
jgi:hypothetical protein